MKSDGTGFSEMETKWFVICPEDDLLNIHMMVVVFHAKDLSQQFLTNL